MCASFGRLRITVMLVRIVSVQAGNYHGIQLGTIDVFDGSFVHGLGYLHIDGKFRYFFDAVGGSDFLNVRLSEDVMLLAAVRQVNTLMFSTIPMMGMFII